MLKEPTIFDYTNHKKLWLWLAENPDKKKDDWPDWSKFPSMAYDCFACEYVLQLCNRYRYIEVEDTIKCRYCPLIWPTSLDCRTLNFSYCGDSNSNLYTQWYHCKHDLNKRSELAKQIANLPIKKNVIVC